MGHQISNERKKELVFVEPLYQDRLPRMLVSVEAVQAMHFAVGVLTRKCDNSFRQLRANRESFFKELRALQSRTKGDRAHVAEAPWSGAEWTVAL